MQAYLNSVSAKAEMAKAMKVGTTSAKGATFAKKNLSQAVQAKVAQAKLANEKWERPSLVAIHRAMAGTDLKAGVLLHHIVFEWANRNKKLERGGQQWLAHSREAWAQASGLTFAEFKNGALPRLKKECCGFLAVQAMGNGADKKLWISVNEMAIMKHYSDVTGMPLDMYLAQLNGIGPGFQKSPSYAYSQAL